MKKAAVVLLVSAPPTILHDQVVLLPARWVQCCVLSAEQSVYFRGLFERFEKEEESESGEN